MTIREARKQAKLSMQKMSDLMGIPRRTIENWEGGQRECPSYVERLVIKELLEIAQQKHKEGSL